MMFRQNGRKLLHWNADTLSQNSAAPHRSAISGLSADELRRVGVYSSVRNTRSQIGDETP